MRDPLGPTRTIRIRGARKNNLRAVDLDIPWGSIVTVTGPSGSGKSSLALDTLWAEGQRRYVETFSSWARQFLDRMDRPEVDEVSGIPPAIAVEQRSRILSSRSTVATLTDLLDHVKLLWSRSAELRCPGCGATVRRLGAREIALEAALIARDAPLLIGFALRKSHLLPPGEVAASLAAQGVRRILVRGRVRNADAAAIGKAGPDPIAVVDRIPRGESDPWRLSDSVELALRLGHGKAVLVELGPAGTPTRELAFTGGLTCPRCAIDTPTPQPGLFSFNSPLGACPTCRGFGRIIEIDPGLVVPDPALTLACGAVRPWTGVAYRRWNERLRRFCERQAIPVDVPWNLLPAASRESIWKGGKGFPGVLGFFRKLEKKSYRMHVRVLLSRYRTHLTCPACGGGRIRSEALRWFVAGLNLPEALALPIKDLHARMAPLTAQLQHDPAASLVLGQMLSRLATACEVGLGYLTLDRDSRTLSGGEVERLGLATALGSSLTSTLYVLDEPSTGLHPRDVDRLVDVVRSLRDRGNTIVLVEHDRRTILASDLVVDMGPGAGEAGGRIVCAGSPDAIMARRDSPSGGWLSGRLRIPVPSTRRPLDSRHILRIEGARARNLQGIDVAIPLGHLVAVTGPSGSGKSTLVEEVLGRGLARRLGVTGPEPGEMIAMTGWEGLKAVVVVDQGPPASTPRANPATYSGEWSSIRKLFASCDLSARHGWGPSVFSFNVTGGRCERCQGSGHEKIEMQFLSDLYLVCPECSGRRFRDEVLEVEVGGKSIADVLEMTIEQANAWLVDQMGQAPRTLAPLLDVGLGYLRFGQSLSTLSGGEAQRLKLAGRLAATRDRPGMVLLDEPTRGLHPSDVARLVAVLQSLVAHGDTVVAVEHDMDFVACADWVIDLGPEAGEHGGRVVAAGPPEQIVQTQGSRTAPYLRDALAGGKAHPAGHARKARRAPSCEPAYERPAPPHDIEIRGAREHNLANVDVTLPLGQLTVVTGPSGSGKSSLVFDVLHAEGQRRWLDSLSAYARQVVEQMPRPDVDLVGAIPPTIAIDQRTSRGGARSTVATMSECLPYLRLLWARAGIQYCPQCQVAVEARTRDALVLGVRHDFAGHTVAVLAPLVRARKGIHREIGSWARERGIEELRVDGRIVSARGFPKLDRFREHTIEAVVARGARPGARDKGPLAALLSKALDLGCGTAAILDEESGNAPRFYSTFGACPACGRGFQELDPRSFSFNSPLGCCPACEGDGFAAGGEPDEPCSACAGARLGPASRAVKAGGWTLPDLLALDVTRASSALTALSLDSRATLIAASILPEVLPRLATLERLGLGYLGLDRRAHTLSSGESQRIRLCAQLASGLRGACIVLDEPTIGLHPRDSSKLIDVLRDLRDRGSTLVVVEHDEDTIRAADHVIDLGPGAGSLGGSVIATGTPDVVATCASSLTGRFLASPPRHPARGSRRPVEQLDRLVVRGARAHNLRGICVEIPLGRLVAVTGPSGSGKSSLVREVVVRGIEGDGIGRTCDAIEGSGAIRRVLLVDQEPIGRTPRSTPATYVNLMDDLRKVFASLPEARARGFGPARFGFNTGPGRCPECKGQGQIKVEMSFLPTMLIECEACRGGRYEPSTLEVRLHGLDISQVLRLGISQAREAFSAVPVLARPLAILEQVGLGYLTLGQPSPTLSGGEAQRLKLASELVRPSGPGALIVLEEPTTGLHSADVEVLAGVMHRLVDAGSTVLVVEHNLDLIAEADWVIDLGPEAGEYGGLVVACGTPESLASSPGSGSHTSLALARMFLRRGLPTLVEPAGRG